MVMRLNLRETRAAAARDDYGSRNEMILSTSSSGRLSKVSERRSICVAGLRLLRLVSRVLIANALELEKEGAS